MADYSAVRGGTAYTQDGSKIGSIDEVYTDNDTGQPTFATVNTGLFGTKTTFVPLEGASVDGNDLRVPYTKDVVKGAPNIDADAEITDEEQDRLYRHYGLTAPSASATGAGYDATGTDAQYASTGTSDAQYATTGTAATTDRDRTDRDSMTMGAGNTGRDTSGPTTDDAMTRSEERLNVGTQVREAGRARLRKYVVTEQQSVEVPVSREELRVEREPITDANRGDAYDGPAISEEEHEITLHEERPVVEKEVEAVERVRVGAETVRSTETVTGEVRKEQIELDDTDTSTTTGRRA